MYSVIKFQAPFERLKEYDYSPDVCLYKAILTQAVIDASNVSAEKEAKALEITAKIWIFSNSQYFQEVCYYAQIDPVFIIKISKEAIKLNIAKKSLLKNSSKIKIDLKGRSIAKNVPHNLLDPKMWLTSNKSSQQI